MPRAVIHGTTGDALSQGKGCPDLLQGVAWTSSAALSHMAVGLSDGMDPMSHCLSLPPLHPDLQDSCATFHRPPLLHLS